MGRYLGGKSKKRNRPPESQIKHWHERIAAYVEKYGPVVRGHGKVDFHHPKGRAYTQNKIHIGSWWVIPIASEFHDIRSNSELNVTYFPSRFSEVYSKQCALWHDMVIRMLDDGEVLPFGDDVINAVLSTNY